MTDYKVVYEPRPPLEMPPVGDHRIGTIIEMSDEEGRVEHYRLSDEQRDGRYWSKMTGQQIAAARASGKLR